MELNRRRPEVREIKEQKRVLQARLEEINALLGARVRGEQNYGWRLSSAASNCGS